MHLCWLSSSSREGSMDTSLNLDYHSCRTGTATEHRASAVLIQHQPVSKFLKWHTDFWTVANSSLVGAALVFRVNLLSKRLRIWSNCVPRVKYLGEQLTSLARVFRPDVSVSVNVIVCSGLSWGTSLCSRKKEAYEIFHTGFL